MSKRLAIVEVGHREMLRGSRAPADATVLEMREDEDRRVVLFKLCSPRLPVVPEGGEIPRRYFGQGDGELYASAYVRLKNARLAGGGVSRDLAGGGVSRDLDLD